MNAFTDKVVLVTGSSRGIGAAIAAAFANDGARVALHGRDRTAAHAVRQRIEESGGTATVHTAELTDLAQIESMRSQIEQTLGPVDVLVANAGGSLTPPTGVEDIDVGAWRATVETNLTATFLTLKSFLPGMKQRGHGSIITLSSAAARRPNASAPFAYAAAKAGIEVLSQAVAAEVGPFGIRVNCIAPETIMTESNQLRIPLEVQQALVQQHPIQRLGTPEDVAQAALFLASEDAAWISGTILDVAGGSVLA